MKTQLPDNQELFNDAWDVFDIGENELQIQKDDEIGLFVSDLEAIGFVFLMAMEGDKKSIAAIKLCYNVGIN